MNSAYNEILHGLMSAEAKIFEIFTRFKSMAVNRNCTSEELLELITATAYMQAMSEKIEPAIKKATEETKQEISNEH
ncbi:hypothetical protein YTPLAS21_19270 [Candidatus Nitrosocosmicus sp.]|nr:hypothetical protein YTPLAS21_19270 [Candidatus Nitrosocosmicus sp.]